MHSITLPQFTKLIIFVLTLAFGQVLFKKVATSLEGNMLGEGFIQLLLDPWFWLAIALYGVSTLLWINILQSVPLSSAYPFVALAFVIVPLSARWFFGEELSLQYFLGIALLVCGIIIMHIRIQ